MSVQTTRDAVRLVISIVVCEGAGLIGSIFTASAIPIWYASLVKPYFTPPNWLFAPAWLTLYLLMAISAFIVWRTGLDKRQVRVALGIFVLQLVLNVLWSLAFFGLHSLLFGVIVILALWLAILLTIVRFFPISRAAGALLLPYIGWVTFAAILNISIRLLNT
jgi:tryptophan-rich sensory protein